MSMGIKVDGFDEINRKLNKISNAAKKIEGNNHIPFTELFPDSFITKYTDFETSQSFVDYCEKLMDADFLSIDENDIKFNDMIQEKTLFNNWNEMAGKATEIWVGKKLGIK